MEDIVIELVIPAGKGAGSGVSSKRLAQVTTAAATAVIDGVTYTRTSPMRTTQEHAGLGIALPTVADPQHSQPAAPSGPSLGNVALVIFSQSGT